MNKSVVIIGGGISGFSFGHFCAINGVKSKILEGSQKAGGCIETVYDNHVGAIELGAHTLTNKYQTLIEIIEYYHGESKIIPKKKLNFRFYTDLGEVSLFKKINFIELIFAFLIRMKTQKEGLTVKEYYSAILGHRNYINTFHYIFQAVICQLPDNFSASLLFKKRLAIKTYYPRFTFKKGVSELFNLMVQEKSIKLNCNIKVTKITSKNEFFFLWNNERKITKTNYLCLTCPPDEAADLLKIIEPEVAKLLSSISISTIESIMISFSAKKKKDKNDICLIGVKQKFLSAIQHIHSNKTYWIFHFPGSLYNMEDKMAVVSKTLNIKIKDCNIESTKTSKLPSLKVGHSKIIDQIQAKLLNKNIFLTSNYMDGLSIEDCCVHAKKEAYRMIKTINEEINF